jgi:hypothetical protein
MAVAGLSEIVILFAHRAAMDKEEVAQHVAIQAFNGLGYVPIGERLSYSILGTAWATGFPKPTPTRGIENDNPWALVPIQYHFEEAIVFRFWAMQAELMYGYVSKIMRMTEEELSIPVRAAMLQPLDVLRSMTQLLLDRAQKRAHIAGSPGTMTPDQAIATYNARVLNYEALVSAAVQDETPIPVRDFQLGLSREHPWTLLLCYCADNLCSALTIDEDRRPLSSIILEFAVSKTQTGLFGAIQRLPQ